MVSIDWSSADKLASLWEFWSGHVVTIRFKLYYVVLIFFKKFLFINFATNINIEYI
jgi:hypothetical protein